MYEPIYDHPEYEESDMPFTEDLETLSEMEARIFPIFDENIREIEHLQRIISDHEGDSL